MRKKILLTSVILFVINSTALRAQLDSLIELYKNNYIIQETEYIELLSKNNYAFIKGINKNTSLKNLEKIKFIPVEWLKFRENFNKNINNVKIEDYLVKDEAKKPETIIVMKNNIS